MIIFFYFIHESIIVAITYEEILEHLDDGVQQGAIFSSLIFIEFIIPILFPSVSEKI